SGVGGWEVVSASFHRARSEGDHPSTRVADGECRVGSVETREPTHAASQLRNAYGGKRRRSAHGADDPGPRGHFDDTGLYVPGIGGRVHGVHAAPSERKAARGAAGRSRVEAMCVSAVAMRRAATSVAAVSIPADAIDGYAAGEPASSTLSIS